MLDCASSKREIGLDAFALGPALPRIRHLRCQWGLGDTCSPVSLAVRAHSCTARAVDVGILRRMPSVLVFYERVFVSPRALPPGTFPECIRDGRLGLAKLEPADRSPARVYAAALPRATQEPGGLGSVSSIAAALSREYDPPR